MMKATILLIGGGRKEGNAMRETLERWGFTVIDDISPGRPLPGLALAHVKKGAPRSYREKISSLSTEIPVILILDGAPTGATADFINSENYEFILYPLDSEENRGRLNRAVSGGMHPGGIAGHFTGVIDLAESINEGIMIVEGETPRYANSGMAEISGYSNLELAAMLPWDLADPEDRGRVREEFNSAISGCSSRRDVKCWIKRKDGGRRFVHNYISPFAPDRSTSGFVVMTSDQTEHRIGWEKLRESEERFRNLAESTPMAILLHQDSKWIFVNPSAEMITGYSSNELKSMNFWDIVHPEHRSMGRERGRKRQAGQLEEPNYELKIITKSGEEKWVFISGTTTQYGGKPAGLINVSDITGIKNIQEKLKESNRELQSKNEELSATLEELEATNEEFERINEELIQSQRELAWSERKFRELFHNVPVGIYQSSPDGRFISANPEMARLLGYGSPEELMSVSDIARDIYHDPDIRDAFVRSIEVREEVNDFEARFMRKDGSLIWASINARLRRGDDGSILYYDGYIRDITRAKQAQEEKERLEKQLLQAQKMEAVGRLAGGIAHDFNNLLTAIIGNAELSLTAQDEASPHEENIRDILTTASRAADLTKQLLAFSRKQIIQPVAVNLNAVLGEMERMLARIIGEDITITMVMEPNLNRIEADPSQIEQLVVNLVVNARDAMPRGGALSVMTANTSADETDSGAKPGLKPGQYAILRITDTGTGIEKEIIDHIFEPFFTTKGDMGTGLGLATVYGITKQNGGYVEVESEPGRGSSFTIYFPVSDKADMAESARKTAAPAPRRGNNETILVIEDEEAVRKLASKALRHEGYTVVEAANGEEAVNACRLHGPSIHLILSDVILPGANGPELMPSLQDIVPGVKVIYMSGYAQDAIVTHSVLKEGINFIPKPFYPSELLKKVKDVLFD